jgi:AcrR family transcriptional regulator
MSQTRPLADGSPTTRSRLLDAAWRVIAADGLRAATSRRITAEAGANLGAITYYFESKNKLVAEAVVAQMQRWTEPLAEAIVADERDASDRTDAVIAALLARFGQSAGEVRGVLEAVLAPDLGREVRAGLQAHLSSFQQVVADVIRRRQHRGEVPRAVQPDATAGMFTAFAFGLLTQELVGANPAPVAEIVGELLALLSNDVATN